ncbi:MAG: hypothetical protein JNK82_00740 [Myxococcaceae bacterium]|nr:hypothetical protein [Myxococcaceae bacterium]
MSTRRLESMLSSVSVIVAAEPRLREEPAEALVELVLASRQPWWRRAACARALKGRVPPSSTSALLELLKHEQTEGEIKRDVLTVLAEPGQPHAERLLGWLRSLEGTAPRWRARDLDVATARGRLNDATVIPQLAVFAADPWPHRSKPAMEALGAVELETLLTQLGATTLEALAFESPAPERRLVGIRLLHARGGDLLPALADPVHLCAREAATLTKPSPALRVLASTRARGSLWARVALHFRGETIPLDAPKYPLPTVPDDVREAIVREYAPGQRDTDPRWILEGASLDPAGRPDPMSSVQRAFDALKAAGLAPENPVSAGDLNQQGEGTYFSIVFGTRFAWVSTLGPFFYLPSADERAAAALVAAGFRDIDVELGATKFDGLCVYQFGEREPLIVGELLFYWQD